MNEPIILFENDHYIGVYKPSGWPTQKTLDPKRKNLEGWVDQHGFPNLTAAHRLDSDTSGVVLFAKDREGRRVLDQLFKEKKITKTYLGLCYGRPATDSGEWDNFVKEGKENGILKMFLTQKGGDQAVTHFTLVKANETLSLVKFFPKTGRMHQIRLHTSSSNIPLVGDELYGPFKHNQGIETYRHWLHAESIQFHDPLSSKEIKIHAEVPKEFFQLFEKGHPKEYLILNKPFDVLCQFTGEAQDKTLADFNLPKDVWPVGRLDKNSEGAVLLTSDKNWRHFIMLPESGKQKIYWAQVEGEINLSSLAAMTSGIKIGTHQTKRCWAKNLVTADVQKYVGLYMPQGPQIRERKNQPTSWIELVLEEGKNHQVRKMTAAVGHPTLRLLRVGYGSLLMEELGAGQWRKLSMVDLLAIGRKAHN